jgi:hypothetical protein
MYEKDKQFFSSYVQHNLFQDATSPAAKCVYILLVSILSTLQHNSASI